MFMLQLFLPWGSSASSSREIRAQWPISKMFELMAASFPEVVDAGREGAGNVRRPYRFRSGQRRLRQNEPSSGVSFAVEAREKVAVVGTSGASKSTLVKLLFRFYDPGAGRILIDGQDIRQLSQASLRRAIGIVPQDTVLFNDSIFENVRYGNPLAPDSEVEEAIRLAHLDDFIRSLPAGRGYRSG